LQVGESIAVQFARATSPWGHWGRLSLQCLSALEPSEVFDARQRPGLIKGGYPLGELVVLPSAHNPKLRQRRLVSRLSLRYRARTASMTGPAQLRLAFTFDVTSPPWPIQDLSWFQSLRLLP